ncbi:BPI fold-containing family B member 6-like [Crotalus tigris]|uniref:BPI fold-containing family B member 6-like n=1 Tax=Crotalus tigris TaxID=88082 RepID=UPI00192F9BD1|nr:BPI fold-containing family B member 6-like [Crotalus tigris]
MDLALKMPWVGVLVFFCVAMGPSELGDSCKANVKFEPPTLLRMVQVIIVRGNILEDMIMKAMKNGDNSKMIKGIKGLKIENMEIPSIIIILKGNYIIITDLFIIISISGKSFIGGQMTITVGGEFNTTGKILILPSSELLLKVTDCKVAVKSCKTNLPSSMLPKIVNKFLDSTLGKVMPGVLCPAADLMMTKLKESFYKILAKKPIGNIGYIVYEVAEKPVVYATHISFILKIKIEKKNGEAIPFKCDPLPDDLPTKEGKTASFFLPSSAIDALMILYQEHLITLLTKVKGSVPTSDQLRKMLPGAGLPAGKKLKIQLTHREYPLVSMSSTGHTITTRIQASFLDVKRGNELLSIQMVHECSALVSIKQELLAISLKAGSCRTTEISSPAGDVSAAKKYMETVMDAGIPNMNGVLSKNPVPFPSLINVTNTPDDAEFIFGDNMITMYKSVEPYTPDEMAKEMKKQFGSIKL